MSNILVRLNFQLANAINVIILTDNLTNSTTFHVHEIKSYVCFNDRSTMLIFVEFVYEGIFDWQIYMYV